MTEQQHPITPSPELVKQWAQSWYDSEVRSVGVVPHVATQAAHWGADQELEACCEWLREARNHGYGYGEGRRLADKLRATRRPKPPSRADAALKALEGLSLPEEAWTAVSFALERLQELEGEQ